ncbi:MAG TPA: aminotransferase class I/II-fold pyridoxal phosphate-dependent enzyme, partial [Gaiellaceae bacterium]|nr:aminotransferase class I/II-fold pyridoxal phosphate-dependent enzyme [Gaiellaceae bacterium]
ALDRARPAGLAWTRPRGGFFTWLTLPDGLDATAFARRAAAAGVAVVPGTPFYPDGRGAANLRLSFSRVEDELIDVGVDRLAALLAESAGPSAP